jgi:hypothetical protein
MINTNRVELSHYTLDQVSNNTQYQLEWKVWVHVDRVVKQIGLPFKVKNQVWFKVFK